MVTSFLQGPVSCHCPIASPCNWRAQSKIIAIPVHYIPRVWSSDFQNEKCFKQEQGEHYVKPK